MQNELNKLEYDSAQKPRGLTAVQLIALTFIESAGAIAGWFIVAPRIWTWICGEGPDEGAFFFFVVGSLVTLVLDTISMVRRASAQSGARPFKILVIRNVLVGLFSFIPGILIAMTTAV